MNLIRLFVATLLLPIFAHGTERVLKIDREKSFVDVAVEATAGSFTAHLDQYKADIAVDAAGKIRSAIFSFGFSDLKTGKTERDDKMIKWLGGGQPLGRFELGALALTPDGQGQASGRLVFNNSVQRVEFPVVVTQNDDGVYQITGETLIDYREWKLKVIRFALAIKVNPEIRISFKLTGSPVAVSSAAAK